MAARIRSLIRWLTGSGRTSCGLADWNGTAGFLYGLVTTTLRRRGDLSVETAGPTKNWTGAVNGTWDTTTPTGSPGNYTDGSKVVFSNSAPNKAISGPAVNPQAITVNNSLGNNYSIANPTRLTDGA